jgi:peroxiredoxin
MELTDEGVVNALGPGRCKRFAMIVEDGVIKTVRVSEAPNDPAGGDDPSLSCVEQQLEDLAAM